MTMPMFLGKFEGPWLFKMQETLLEFSVNKKMGACIFKRAPFQKDSAGSLSSSTVHLPIHPLPPLHLYQQGAYRNQDSIQSFFLFKVSLLVHACG
jgi:hypothetical protein